LLLTLIFANQYLSRSSFRVLFLWENELVIRQTW